MSTPNDEFIKVWNEILFPKFQRFRDAFVSIAQPHSAIALAKHGPKTGDRAFDIGCGFGETTLDLGRLVGPKGSAVGYDCCDGFIDTAKREAKAANVTNVSFASVDVQTHPFDETFDYAFGRFGTMFFQAPKAALRNIRGALRPGGRFVNVTWRAITENPPFALPKEIALRHLPPPPGDGRSCGPGPFSMADAVVVREICEGAGFVDVALEAVNVPAVIGRDVEETIALQLELGPAGEIVREAGELGKSKREEIVADLRAGLAPFVTPRGVVMNTSSWCITATNPA